MRKCLPISDGTEAATREIARVDGSYVAHSDSPSGDRKALGPRRPIRVQVTAVAPPALYQNLMARAISSYQENTPDNLCLEDFPPLFTLKR